LRTAEERKRPQTPAVVIDVPKRKNRARHYSKIAENNELDIRNVPKETLYFLTHHGEAASAYMTESDNLSQYEKSCERNDDGPCDTRYPDYFSSCSYGMCCFSISIADDIKADIDRDISASMNSNKSDNESVRDIYSAMFIVYNAKMPKRAELTLFELVFIIFPSIGDNQLNMYVISQIYLYFQAIITRRLGSRKRA
jgi:hypothetical protein